MLTHASPGATLARPASVESDETAALAQEANNRALACCDAGDLEGARMALEHAKVLVEQIHGYEERARAEAATLGNCGYLAKRTGNLGLAAGYFEEALQVEAQWGSPHPTTTLNLAVVLNSQGAYNKARDLSKLALDLLAEKDNTPDPAPAQVWVAAWHNLAVSQLWATSKSQNVDVVWTYFKTALRTARQSLGRHHPLTQEVSESFNAAKRSWQATKSNKQQGIPSSRHGHDDLASTPSTAVRSAMPPPRRRPSGARRPPPEAAPSRKTKAERAAETARNRMREDAWDATGVRPAAAPPHVPNRSELREQPRHPDDALFPQGAGRRTSHPAGGVPSLPQLAASAGGGGAGGSSRDDLYAETALLRQLEAESVRKDAELEALRAAMAGDAPPHRTYADMCHEYTMAQMELSELKRQLFVLRKRVGELSKAQAVEATRRTVLQTWDHYSDYAGGGARHDALQQQASAPPPTQMAVVSKGGPGTVRAASRTYPARQRQGSRGRPLPELQGGVPLPTTAGGDTAAPHRAPLPPLANTHAWQPPPAPRPPQQPPPARSPAGTLKPAPPAHARGGGSRGGPAAPGAAAPPASVWTQAEADDIAKAVASMARAAAITAPSTVRDPVAAAPGAGLQVLYAALRPVGCAGAGLSANRGAARSSGRSPRAVGGGGAPGRRSSPTKADPAAGGAGGKAAAPATTIGVLVHVLQAGCAARARAARHHQQQQQRAHKTPSPTPSPRAPAPPAREGAGSAPPRRVAAQQQQQQQQQPSPKRRSASTSNRAAPTASTALRTAPAAAASAPLKSALKATAPAKEPKYAPAAPEPASRRATSPPPAARMTQRSHLMSSLQHQNLHNLNLLLEVDAGAATRGTCMALHYLNELSGQTMRRHLFGDDARAEPGPGVQLVIDMASEDSEYWYGAPWLGSRGDLGALAYLLRAATGQDDVAPAPRAAVGTAPGPGGRASSDNDSGPARGVGLALLARAAQQEATVPPRRGSIAALLEAHGTGGAGARRQSDVYDVLKMACTNADGEDLTGLNALLPMMC